MNVKALVPPWIQALEPYPPGKPIEELEREYGVVGSIKLASNENPVGPSPKALAALQGALSQIHRYPDGACYYLRRALARKYGLSPEAVLVGNGSNEIIEIAVRTFLRQGEEAVMAILNSINKIDKNTGIKESLKKRGINIYDSSGQIKSIQALLPEFKKLSEVIDTLPDDKKSQAIAMLFGRPEAVRDVKYLINHYDDIIKKTEYLQSATNSLGNDFQNNAQSNANKLKLFQNQVDSFKVEHMTGAMQGLSTTLTYINNHPALTKGALSAVGFAAAVVGVNKVISAMKALNLVLGTGPLGFIIRGAMIGTAIGTAANEAIDYSVQKISKGKYKTAAESLYGATHADEAYQSELQMMLNTWAAEASKAGDRETARDILNQIKLIVNIDKDGRIRTDSSDLNTTVDLDVARGDFGY